MFFRQKKHPSFPDPSIRSQQSDGFRSSLLPLPLSLSLLDADEAYNEPEFSKEDAAELKDGWTVIDPDEGLPDNILDLIINGDKGRGEA